MGIPRSRQWVAGGFLLLHALPYVVLLSALGRLVILGVLGLPLDWGWAAYWITVGIAVGVAFGIAFGIAGGIALAIPDGIAFGIAVGIALAIAGGIAVGIAFAIAVLRVYYHPAHLFFVWPRPRGSWYPHHPVAWDDVCSVPFPGLDRLLVAYAQRNVLAAEQEIERLITSYPTQRMAALRARVTLLARKAGQLSDLARLDEVLAKLPQGDKGFLRQTQQIRQWVHEISGLQTRLNTIQRPIFREPTAQLLSTEIENFQHRVAGLEEPLATEFRAAAEGWRQLAARQLEQARAVLSQAPVPQVFRAGDPVDRDHEAFVPRDRVVGELEQQVLLSTGCPGIVLYGRRRMGKSTVLRNLAGFLPTNLAPVVISMQEPLAFTSLDSLVRRIASSVESETKPGAEPADLPGLYRFLSDCNARLESENKRLLLAMDEYNTIDSKIGEGVFPRDLLATLRESIQTHRHITWIFSGSHEITELPNAPWTSYLVSARTIEVPAFSLPETRLLLTQPLKYSSLWPEDSAGRPRFPTEFWGDGGIERIHAQADGWPHLVQLIAETVIDLINDEETRSVNSGLLERALNQSIIRGHNVLYELMCRECSLPGEWEYLSAFRRNPEQPPPENEALCASLRRRQLIREEDGMWRLRVPLMARWLRERG